MEQVTGPLDIVGRYVEQEIKLPVPDGSAAQYGHYLIGVFRDGDAICAIGCSSTGDEKNYRAQYHRYRIGADGTVAASEETG